MARRWFGDRLDLVGAVCSTPFGICGYVWRWRIRCRPFGPQSSPEVFVTRWSADRGDLARDLEVVRERFVHARAFVTAEDVPSGAPLPAKLARSLWV